MSGKGLTVSFISNQFGPPAELKQIASKNAGWDRVESIKSENTHTLAHSSAHSHARTNG